jgi:hypothetical protein
MASFRTKFNIGDRVYFIRDYTIIDDGYVNEINICIDKNEKIVKYTFNLGGGWRVEVKEEKVSATKDKLEKLVKKELNLLRMG